jgi:hypothetical protein
MNKLQREEFIERLYAAFSGGDSDAISVQATSPSVPPNALKELETMFEQELARPDGLRRIAFAMHPVLKRRLDYQAIGRNNILVVDELTTGDVPFYDVDIPEIGAIFVATQGEPPHQMAGPERIQFPTSNLAIIESVHYDQIQIRRYPLFDRAKERAAIAIAIGEDDAILGETGVMHTATTVGPNSVVVANNLSRFVLAEVGKRIVNQQLVFTTIVMHPIQYAEIWKWSANELDQVHLNRVVETGWMGGYLGAKLLVSTRCKRDSVYGLTSAEKVGHLPERKAVEVKVFDNVPRMRYDILAWEQIGVGIHNTGGVARADLLKGGV